MFQVGEERTGGDGVHKEHLVGPHAVAVVRNAHEPDAHRPQVRKHRRVGFLLGDQEVALVDEQVKELQHNRMCNATNFDWIAI